MPDTSLGQRPTVILCEAYDSLREGLALVLGDYHSVVSTCHVKELPALLANATPDLLIVDVDDQPAPYPALGRIREVYKSVPILLLAREFSLEQQLEAVQLLTNVGFVTKPFSLDLVLEKVQTLIQSYSSSPIRRHVVRVPSVTPR